VSSPRALLLPNPSNPRNTSPSLHLEFPTLLCRYASGEGLGFAMRGFTM